MRNERRLARNCCRPSFDSHASLDRSQRQHRHTKTMAQAYAHLQPDFDPAKAKVAELRGILLQHDVSDAVRSGVHGLD